MSSDILMALLITIILFHIVKVITANNNGAFHLGTDDNSSEDTAANGDISSEGALLIDVGTSYGFLRGLESKTNVLVPAVAFALWHNTLVVKEDGLLLLKAALVLRRMD